MEAHATVVGREALRFLQVLLTPGMEPGTGRRRYGKGSDFPKERIAYTASCPKVSDLRALSVRDRLQLPSRVKLTTIVGLSELAETANSNQRCLMRDDLG